MLEKGDFKWVWESFGFFFVKVPKYPEMDIA